MRDIISQLNLAQSVQPSTGEIEIYQLVDDHIKFAPITVSKNALSAAGIEIPEATENERLVLLVNESADSNVNGVFVTVGNEGEFISTQALHVVENANICEIVHLLGGQTSAGGSDVWTENTRSELDLISQSSRGLSEAFGLI